MRKRNGYGWNWLLILAVATGLTLTGCGGSEEVMQEEGAAEEVQPLGTEEEAPAQQADPDADALTSFIGDAPKEVKAEEPAAQPPTQLGAYEKQIEDLRTENTTLKQRLVKLEQDNRTLNTMVSENESKIQAARERADSLEMAMMNRPVAEPAAETPAMVEQPAAATQEPMTATGYEEALQAFNARKYDEAIFSLNAMLAEGATKDLEDNCYYWIGESNFAKRQYDEAISAFEKVLTFAVSEKKGDATYMMAQSFERKGDKTRAKDGYEKVVKDYPMSNVVKKAKERWAKL